MTYRSHDHRDLQLGAVVASAAIGALVMYLFDPDRGARRRGVAMDTLREVGRDTAQTVTGTIRELSHRAGAADVFHTRDSDEFGSGVATPSVATPGVATSSLSKSGIDPTRATAPRAHRSDAADAAPDRLRPHSLGALFSAPATGIKAIAQGLRERSWDPKVRNAALLGGGALGLFSLVTRRSPLTMAAGLAGAAMLARGATDRPLAGSVARVFTRLGAKSGAGAVEIEKTIRIGAAPEQVYDMWADYENFPRFMKNVVAVRDLGANLSHWTVKGPAGAHLEWDSILTEQSRPHRLAWRSVPGGQVEQRGEIRLEAVDGGTRATVRMSYTAPAGAAGAAGQALASLIGSDPAAQLGEDLRRMKRLLERGRLPYSSAHGGMLDSRPMH